MKTVFITGASSGIGKAAALLFAARGWNVAAGMRTPDETFENEKNIFVVRIDVTQSASIQNAVAESIERFGSIDALVNSAGYGLMGVFESADLQQIKNQYEVNVFGLMDVTQRVLPYMRKNGSGSIINLSSFGGIIALPFGSFYNSSKFAVEGFSESLSHEVSSFNIKVKIIEPGSIATNFRNNIDMVVGDIPAYKTLMESFFPRFLKMTEDIPKNTAADVAETIYQASTDGNDILRYVSGADAQFYIDLKRKNNDEAFIQDIRYHFFKS